MANEFIVKNGFKSQGDSEVTGSFTATSGMSGSFSGSFQGDGSNLSNVTLPAGVVSGSAQISYTGITDVPSGIVSSSAQIASDISGSFGAASASFSTRVTTNETDISTLTAATASYLTATPTLQQVTDQGASTSNDINITGDLTASADILVPTQNASINMINGSILSRTGGSYPGIQLNSGATNNTIWFLAGNNNSIGGEVTASFVSSGFINNVGVIRARANASLLLQGGPAPNDANDGVKIETADASDVYQPRFQIESDTATVDAYFTNINGLGINDSTPTAMLDVNGNINTTSDITASGDISAGTFTGDGSGITGVISASYAVTASHALNTAPFPFSGSAVITGSLIVTGSASVNGNFQVTGSDGDIDTSIGRLYDSSGKLSVSYGQRGLYSDNGTSVSVAYNTRRLYGSDGTSIAFDWSTGDLNSPTNGILAVDIGERTLNDRFGNEIGNWQTTAVSYFSGSLIGTASYADNATSASYALSASHLIGGGGGSDPAININANGTTLTEVTSDSDLPTTLAANTTYLIRGNVSTGKTLNVTNVGSSVIGIGRNQSHLSYTGSNELFNVHDASFSIRSLTMKSSGSIMTAKNVSPGAAYNDGRTKVLDIKDCQVKNTNNVMEVHGFELVDLNNVLFWYITGSQGLSFQSVRHLEISSCEFYNWYDETDTGSFAPAGTKMVEIRPNTGSVNTPVVNINSSIFHPEQSQIGLYIDSGSETLFGTVASNTFIDVNGGTLLAGSNYDSGSMLKYDIGINQGLEDSKAYLYGYQNGTDAQGATTTYTQISIASFSTDIETRMSASTSGITYIGTKPIDVMFQINAGVTDIGSNNEQFDFALYKNTTLIPGSERRIELDTGEEGSVTCFALTNIVQNDLLTVYQKSPSNDGFTLQNFAIMIKE